MNDNTLLDGLLGGLREITVYVQMRRRLSQTVRPCEALRFVGVKYLFVANKTVFLGWKSPATEINRVNFRVATTTSRLTSPMEAVI
jgi:hypothetical protein